jgi:hypothetical protein
LGKTLGEIGGWRQAEKKSLKKVWPGVGGEKKTITFAARFVRNGGKIETEWPPSGAVTAYRGFFDVMAPREKRKEVGNYNF